MDHIEPILPFVSDLGVIPPEASLFSLFMNIGSILILIFTLIRYESTKINNQNMNDVINDVMNDVMNDVSYKSIINTLNRYSLITGLIMTTGFLFVANFRNSEGYVVQSIHNIAAVAGFSSSVFDIYFQSRIAFEFGNKNIARFRCLISGFCLLMVVSYIVLSICSFVLYPEALSDTHKRLKWNNSQTGYNSHIISTIFEWILIFMLSPYLATFVPQFNNFQFSKQIIVRKDNNHNINFRNHFRNRTTNCVV
jgi:hypothetical protein